MNGKRDLIAKVANRTGVVSLALTLRRQVAVPQLTVLTYHRVFDLVGNERFDPEVVDASRAQFEAQCATIARYFSAVDCRDLIRYLDGGRLPKNPCMITFDDGYRDCLRNALPILRKHGLKATFFIATDFVEDRRMYWWDRVNYLALAAEQQRFTITYPTEESFDLRNQRERSVYRLLRIIKDHKGLDLEKFLIQLANAMEVPWDRDIERAMADDLVMTWDQVRQMRDAGMDIQSHTRTHRVLQTVPEELLENELLGARVILEREMGAPVQALAYPVGKAIREQPKIVAAVEGAGYRLGFSNVTGSDRLSRSMDPYDISRIGMDVGLTSDRFRAMMALPFLG